MRIEEDLKQFGDADLTQAPNLLRLRTALGALIQVAQMLESRITEAIITAQTADQTDQDPPKAPRRRRTAAENGQSPQETMQAQADAETRKRALELAQATVDKADDLAAAKKRPGRKPAAAKK
jgi:hypothetical protein